MKSLIINELAGITDVSVVRSGAASDGGYTWTVSHEDMSCLYILLHLFLHMHKFLPTAGCFC